MTRNDDRPRYARLSRALAPVWADQRLGVGIAGGVVVLWAVLAGWWTPRGPLTSGEALWSLASSLLVGAVAGLALRTRWTVLLAPLAFAVTFELTRLGTDGPLVDEIHVSQYGLLAVAAGRGFHSLLALVPMALGAALGAASARGLGPAPVAPAGRRVGRYARRGVASLTTVALLVLAVGLARPASTAAIVGPEGEALPGSIAELSTVELGGHDLGLMIRGHDLDNPVLLFLAGGPGGSERGAMRNHLPELEEHFTVVTWDQRGTGTSYPELDPVDTVTVDAVVDDTIALTEHLRERFGQDQIYLLGQSWGTTLGVLAVQERPDLYRAYIGTGQMVSQLATDRIYFDDTLAWARANGKDALAADLEDIGQPPYDRILDYETNLSYEMDVYPYDHSANSEGMGGFSENFIVPEYALIDQAHLLAGFLDTFAVLYPQLQDIDFRRTATEFDLPVFFAQGAHEAGGRADVFDDWYPMVDAPVKDLAVFDTSGHRPLFEQPDEFVDYMVDTVLAETWDPVTAR